MEAFDTKETTIVKEEPIDANDPSSEFVDAGSYGQLCSAQYAEGSYDGHSSDPLMKKETPDSSEISGALISLGSNAVKKEEVVEPPAADNLYSAKCELICTENEGDGHNTEPQPTPSTSTASKAEDNFEFISVGGIKQEEPEWTSDAEEGDPNPLQDDQQSTLQQDDDPDSSSSSENSGSGEFECGWCHKSFHQSELLRKHSKTHKKVPLRCYICKMKFTCKKPFMIHMKTHSQEERDACRVLDAKLKIYRQNKRRAAGNPYHCGVCQKQFKIKPELGRHVVTHTGAKPYQCGVCKKQWSQLTALTLHMLVHTRATPYHCQVCKKGFKKKQELMVHSRLHTGVKPFSCPDCRKQFRQYGNMTNHRKNHTGEKSTTCGFCKKQFKTMANLNRHILTHCT